MATIAGVDLNQDVYDEAQRSQLFSYDVYEQDRASFEKTFNVLGYIPAVSTASASVRILVNVCALIKHIVSASLCAIIDLFKSSPNGSHFRALKNISYIGHDIHNIIRGIVEFIPLIGNISTICYDGFIGRWSYPVESTGVHYRKGF